MKWLALVGGLVVSLMFTGCGTRVVSHNPHTVTMVGANFAPTTITIPADVNIAFLDDSDNSATHFLVIGTNGQSENETGAQDFGGLAGHRMVAGDLWTTALWTKPGTYHITCTVHPQMNLTIIVTP